MKQLAIGVLSAALMLASADATRGQGSTGGTLGKTDQSLSGDQVKKPNPEGAPGPRPSKQSAPAYVGIAGRWSWKVTCPIGNWAGDFVVRPASNSAFSGEFLTGGGDLMLNGRLEGSQLSFTRQFNSSQHVQSWKGSLTQSGARIVGSYTDHTVMGVICTWEATRR